MANHKSAEKRARQTKTRTARNVSSISRLKTSIKKFRAAVAGNEKEKAGELLKLAASYAMHLSSKRIIHKNNAARKVSSMSRLYNTIK